MRKKVLIFGLGKQAGKYIDYFYTTGGYDIIGVSWSGENKRLYPLREVFAYQEISQKPDTFFESFDIIIVAVFPLESQETVIKLLLAREVVNQCIIEKPVSYNSEILMQLSQKENFLFFIDELFLTGVFDKIFKVLKNISIEIPLGNTEKNSHILEHAFGAFLLREDFCLSNFYIESLVLPLKTRVSTDLVYALGDTSKKVLSVKGRFFLGESFFTELSFARSLEFLLTLHPSEKLLYKQNFISARQYIQSHFGSS